MTAGRPGPVAVVEDQAPVLPRTARVVGVGAAGRQGETGGAGGLGGAGDGAQVPRVLDAVEVDRDGTVRGDRQRLGAAPRQAGDRQQALGSVGVGQLGQDLAGHLERRLGQAGEEGRLAEIGRRVDLVQGETGSDRLAEQVGPFEQNPVIALPARAAQAAQRLEPGVLAAGDHGPDCRESVERPVRRGVRRMYVGDFWQRLQRGVEVAVAGSTPDRQLGVRDGFRRFFRERFDRPISIAVVAQEGLEEPTGLPITDEELMTLVESRTEDLERRLRGHYHFFVASEGGLHTVERNGRALHFVRNWTLIASPIGRAWGASGSVQLPTQLVSGLARDQMPFAVPGTRRSGGMISSLTGGLETRRRAVETATLHALSTLFYGMLGTTGARPVGQP